MARHLITAASVIFAITLFSCDGIGETKGAKKPITDAKEKFSYALGLDIAASLTPFKDKINLDLVCAAIKDSLSGAGNRLTAEDAAKVKDSCFKIIQADMMAEAKKKAEENVKKADEFLAKNKTKAGVITTATGLQYEVLKKGDGPMPTAEDMVKVHYVGTLLDGTEFDSSIKRGEPATFACGMVIPGWTEALKLMPVGSKYKLYIPANLGYGERGAGPIPPNSLLIFEVELLEIVKKDAAAPAVPGQK